MLKQFHMQQYTLNVLYTVVFMGVAGVCVFFCVLMTWFIGRALLCFSSHTATRCQPCDTVRFLCGSVYVVPCVCVCGRIDDDNAPAYRELPEMSDGDGCDEGTLQGGEGESETLRRDSGVAVERSLHGSGVDSSARNKTVVTNGSAAG